MRSYVYAGSEFSQTTTWMKAEVRTCVELSYNFVFTRQLFLNSAPASAPATATTLATGRARATATVVYNLVAIQ